MHKPLFRQFAALVNHGPSCRLRHLPINWTPLAPLKDAIHGYGDAGRWNFQMFHEVGHMMELVHKGQPERLQLNNFGFPSQPDGCTLIQWTAASATAECRALAYHYLMEEHLLGVQDPHGFAPMAEIDFVFKRWCEPMYREERNPAGDLAAWYAQRSAKQRIESFMSEFRPAYADVFHETVDYIDNRCRHLL